MPWPDDLATLMESAGAGTFNTDIFVGPLASIPDLPVGTITIRATSGSAPERTHNSVSIPAYIQPAAQIIARARTWTAAREKARRAYIAITGVRNQVISGGFYREITALQEPFDLPLEERGLVAQAFNVTAIKRSEEVT